MRQGHHVRENSATIDDQQLSRQARRVPAVGSARSSPASIISTCVVDRPCGRCRVAVDSVFPLMSMKGQRARLRKLVSQLNDFERAVQKELRQSRQRSGRPPANRAKRRIAR